MKKIVNLQAIFAILFGVAAFMLVTPSIGYLINNNTVYEFNQWFKFTLNDADRMAQTIQYIIILTIITVLYILIVKNRNKIFKDIKQVIIFVAIISFIFIFMIPFMSSDIFYYLGVGRLESKYGQNPYYNTIAEYVHNNIENNPKLVEDTVLMQGYQNPWSRTAVVYGPVWQLICRGASALSFGNVDIGLLVFKILNATVHIMNCYLIYKITKKRIFSLIYGLNPFVLIEGIGCVHNDIFVVLFILLSLYFLLKNKKLVLSMIFLALATAIKYYAILLLPFIIIYGFRNEKASVRFINCVKYGLIFLVALIVPYLLYIRDLGMLSAMLNQQNLICKSIYLLIKLYMPELSIDSISTTLLAIFIIIYFFTCLTLLYKRKITLNDMIQKYTLFLLAFTFLLLTKFQPWYLMWLLPIFMWLKPKNLRLIIGLGIISQFANSIFLLKGEEYQYGTIFILLMFIGMLGQIVTEAIRAKTKLLKKGKG